MIKILFIGYGNICRPTMAEFILKDMVKRDKIEEDFYIESAATSREGIGNFDETYDDILLGLSYMLKQLKVR